MTGVGPFDVNGRINTALEQVSVQLQFHVTCPLELFKNNFVHTAAGIDQGGRDDRKTAALLDPAGRAEESFRLVQGVGVHPAGQDLAAVRTTVLYARAKRVMLSNKITTSRVMLD